MFEMNPSTEEQAKTMPGMQRGKAKLLMMPVVMLKMGKLNHCAEERAKLLGAELNNVGEQLIPKQLDSPQLHLGLLRGTVPLH